MSPYDEHAGKCEALCRAMAASRRQGVGVQLSKSTSNLFRHRHNRAAFALDVRNLNHVLSVDPRTMTADVEGMAPYDAIVKETLRYGLLPAVVPQLKSITAGGAVSGIGIESSSFRFGLVHETMEDLDVLLGDGTVLTCSRTKNSDLFYGFPNSYGTLGYALRLRLRLIPAARYVRLRHERFTGAGAFLERIGELCAARRPDYLDGVVFGPDEMYVTTGEFTGEAPRTSNYTWMKIYYESIRTHREDWLTAQDYIWRWDTDWFWCSKNLYAQFRLVRLLATPLFLNSRTYQRIMRLAHRALPDRGGSESVIQDVDIPIRNAGEFLMFLLSSMRITPIWICPIQAGRADESFALYALDPSTPHINFGFWDVIPSEFEAGHYNRLVERKLLEAGGRKGLYSSVYFDSDTFWKLYNRSCYEALKGRYDPCGAFRDLYAKCTQP